MRSPENVLESLKSKACNKAYKYGAVIPQPVQSTTQSAGVSADRGPKPGNMTAGTAGKTIDGSGMKG